MKILVFAEKPSVAKEMARVLNCSQKRKGFFEGNKYIVTWALGHLATLFEPGDYNKIYKNWDLDHLPIIPEKLKVKKLSKVSFQFNIVSSLMNRKDVSELIIATDAGREGELVARWTMLLARFNKPFKRLWISSQTDKAIKDGFNNLKPGKDYNRLFKAATCRAEADWIIGLNLTRALTCKFNSQLSAGRVQTPTLNMIVERDEVIKNFQPVPYWEIRAEFNGFFGHWRDKTSNSSRIFDTIKLNDIKNKCEGKNGKVIDVKIKEKSEQAPLLYDLTELQREANRRFSFSAKRTLSIMQILYERYKIVTYPRTDSKYITTDMVDTLKERLIALKSSTYSKKANEILNKPIKTSKRIVNNSKVTDHHAIIPTEQRPNMSALGNDEKKIYNLIVKRFLSVLLPDHIYKEIKIVTEIEGEHFHSKGKEVLSQGWKEIETNMEVKENSSKETLPEQNLRVKRIGDVLKINKLETPKSMTKPPARYTEGSLLAQMEKGSLGTPATRADIIEKIINTFYVEREGKYLKSTSKGKQLIDIVPNIMRSANLTAQWENWLDKISKGEDNPNKFMDDIRSKSFELIDEVKKSEVEFKYDNLTNEMCPMCKKPMLRVKGKKNKEMLVCQDRTCGYREDVKRKNDTGINISKREKFQNKKLINQYTDNQESVGQNLGDLLKNFVK